jgi:radical S-adenosyl methionine domain-containing protein 2
MQIAYNLHITERCNYKCEFCYAKWGCKEEIWTDGSVVRKLLDELSDKKSVSERVGAEVDSVRINFAGGEPLMPAVYQSFSDILKRAKGMGFETSIITNGSLLSGKEEYKHLGSLEIFI